MSMNVIEINTNTSLGIFSGSKDSVIFPINIMGGYQWYFYNRKWFHLGVALRTHIGYTNYNVVLEDYYVYSYKYGILDITAHGIQYGMEAQFIWDFLNIGAHTLGVHIAPLGFEGSTIIWNGQGDWGNRRNKNKRWGYRY